MSLVGVLCTYLSDKENSVLYKMHQSSGNLIGCAINDVKNWELFRCIALAMREMALKQRWARATHLKPEQLR